MHASAHAQRDTHTQKHKQTHTHTHTHTRTHPRNARTHARTHHTHHNKYTPAGSECRLSLALSLALLLEISLPLSLRDSARFSLATWAEIRSDSAVNFSSQSPQTSKPLIMVQKGSATPRSCAVHRLKNDVRALAWFCACPARVFATPAVRGLRPCPAIPRSAT